MEPPDGPVVALGERLADLWRLAGTALVGPLVLVGVTGLLVLFGYNANPEVAHDRLREAEPWFRFVRSLHLWSSNALLAGVVAHVTWSWRARRVGGPHRSAYVLGTTLLGLVVLEHFTGHVLVWDSAARELASFQNALLPGRGVPETLQLPAHVGLLGGLALVVSLLHVGLVGSGSHARVRPAFPQGWPVHRKLAILAGVLLVALLALAVPAPVGRTALPWPFGIFAAVASVAGAWAFLAAGALAWFLVAFQPSLERFTWAAWATRAVLGLLFLASFAWT